LSCVLLLICLFGCGDVWRLLSCVVLLIYLFGCGGVWRLLSIK
jgi:hypothetical protein